MPTLAQRPELTRICKRANITPMSSVRALEFSLLFSICKRANITALCLPSVLERSENKINNGHGPRVTKSKHHRSAGLVCAPYYLHVSAMAATRGRLARCERRRVSQVACPSVSYHHRAIACESVCSDSVCRRSGRYWCVWHSWMQCV